MSNSILTTIGLVISSRTDSDVPPYVTNGLLSAYDWKAIAEAQASQPESFFRTVMKYYLPFPNENMTQEDFSIVVEEMSNMSLSSEDTEAHILSKLFTRLDKIKNRPNSERSLHLCGLFLGRITLFCPALKTFFKNPFNILGIDKIAGRVCYNSFIETYSVSDPKNVIRQLVKGSIPADIDTFEKLIYWDGASSSSLMQKLSTLIDKMADATREGLLNWLFRCPSNAQHANIQNVLPHLIRKCEQENDYTTILCTVTPKQVREFGVSDLPYILDQWVNNSKDLPVILLMRTLQKHGSNEEDTIIPSLVSHILRTDTTEDYSQYINKERALAYCDCISG